MRREALRGGAVELRSMAKVMDEMANGVTVSDAQILGISCAVSRLAHDISDLSGAGVRLHIATVERAR